VIVPLSAKTPEQLKQMANNLLESICGPRGDHGSNQLSAAAIDLTSLAYTLQTGREAMEERLAFVVESIDQLLQRLRSWVSGGKSVEDTYRGTVGRLNEELAIIAHDEDMQEAVARWMLRGKLPKLAELWVRGLTFDWNTLHGDLKPRRMSLPVYPFAGERHWIDGTASNQQSVRPTGRNMRESTTSRLRAVEDVLNRIDAGTLERKQAVALLNKVV
jgi:polyketide synthase PksN